ncbi:tail assembly protein, partial [Escherichia coli ARS4.2123]
SSGGD